MNDGKHCPACGKDIGIWAVLVAGLPTRVRCPHCKTRLSYGSSLLLMFGVVTLVALVALASYHVASQFLGRNSRLIEPIKFYAVAIGAFLAMWIPVEATFAYVMRSRGRLNRLDQGG